MHENFVHLFLLSSGTSSLIMLIYQSFYLDIIYPASF